MQPRYYQELAVHAATDAIGNGTERILLTLATGTGNNEGSWRTILAHFSPAVHIGLTATPKRTDNIDTYNYFGQPTYEYSLKDGINDGFLTPYRVKRICANLDELVLTAVDQIIKGESNQDMYDLLAFIAFELPMETRRARAEATRKSNTLSLNSLKNNRLAIFCASYWGDMKTPASRNSPETVCLH